MATTRRAAGKAPRQRVLPKAAAKKVPAAAAKAGTAAAPPFFGQGDAQYFEWFEMFVLFAAPVAKAKRKEVLAAAPKLCAMDASWPHPALLWASTGDQWIQRHLVEQYGSAAAKARMKKAWKKQAASDDFDDDLLEDMVASDGEEKAFNADIERWLLSLHAKYPILLVARDEDGEAGGPKLGAWHKRSVAELATAVLPALHALAKEGLPGDDMRRAPLGIMADFVGPKRLPPAIRKLCVPPGEDE